MQYAITRQECDEYAQRSQMLWAAGHASGAFVNETVPVEVKTKKGPKVHYGVIAPTSIPSKFGDLLVARLTPLLDT